MTALPGRQVKRDLTLTPDLGQRSDDPLASKVANSHLIWPTEGGPYLLIRDRPTERWSIRKVVNTGREWAHREHRNTQWR